jgi:ribonucleotide reductase beta subunit family protein with ferritin-like domain
METLQNMTNNSHEVTNLMSDYNSSEARIELDNKLKSNKVMNETDEYLLNPENNRLTMYPILNKLIWEQYKKQQAAFWTAEDIDFSHDYNDFQKLTPNEQYFIKMILAFFSSSDTLVNINLGDRFLQDVKIREAITTYQFQMMMENIHSETYSLQIDNAIRDPEEKEKLFNAVREFPCIAEKASWALKWIESGDSFAKRLLAFAIFEGVFFSGSFCAIFWLKKRNKMPGLCASNEMIARDEGLHCSFAVLLYSMLKNKLPEADVHLMFQDAVEIERKFICESLPCALIGMNATNMTQYIEFVADRLLVDLGYSKFFNSKNPFDFMESISIEGKTNFFESRPTQYQRASTFNKTRNSGFVLTEDF